MVIRTIQRNIIIFKIYFVAIVNVLKCSHPFSKKKGTTFTNYKIEANENDVNINFAFSYSIGPSNMYIHN